MPELVLNPLERTLDDDVARNAERTGTRDEFESRLAECGPLAFRVARGVLRNTADAEDVAQDTLLRAYRNFYGIVYGRTDRRLQRVSSASRSRSRRATRKIPPGADPFRDRGPHTR